MWEHNIEMNLREIGWIGVDWIDLALDMEQLLAHGNTGMNLAVPKKLGNS
jgi:hypothetical protein